MKHSTGPSPTGLHKKQTSLETISGSRLRTPTGLGKWEEPPSRRPQGEKGLQEGAKPEAYMHIWPTTILSFPLPIREGSKQKVGFGPRPMKKMSLPHAQKWPQGGARHLIGKDLHCLDAPPPPKGRSQGHAPSPPAPKAPERGESRKRKGEGRGCNSSSSSHPIARVHETWTMPQQKPPDPGRGLQKVWKHCLSQETPYVVKGPR